jgi:N-acetylglucosamine-6-sulfatase
MTAWVVSLGNLEKSGELEDTVVLYLGDNGFIFGEHGLIDKRCAYDESIRIPMLMRYPKSLKPGTKVEKIVANIDVAPTLLEVAGLKSKGANGWGKLLAACKREKEL